MNTMAIGFERSFSMEKCTLTSGCWPNARKWIAFSAFKTFEPNKACVIKKNLNAIGQNAEWNHCARRKMKLKLVFVDEERIAMPCAQTHETLNYINSYALCVDDYFAKSFVYSICLRLCCCCCWFLGRLLASNEKERGRKSNCNSCFAIKAYRRNYNGKPTRIVAYELWLGFHTCHFMSKLVIEQIKHWLCVCMLCCLPFELPR